MYIQIYLLNIFLNNNKYIFIIYMGIIFSKLKYYRQKKNDTDEEVALIIDYSTEINKIEEKTDDLVKYLQDDLVPVINELKSRIYYLEVNNNKINRYLSILENKDNNSDLFLSTDCPSLI